VLITGAYGMLATDLVPLLRAAGHRVLAQGRQALDITDPAQIRRALGRHRPQAVVNCAAHTAVDLAENDPQSAMLINAEGPRLLAEACADLGARLVHLSTDYVFSGDTTVPYAEDAPPGPRTVYGRSKLLGEQAVLRTLPDTGCVVRCSWLYGNGGPNFVTTMRRLAAERPYVEVVDDQYGQPTWTHDVAQSLALLLSAPPLSGVLHASNRGETNWHGLAREVFTLLGADPARVRPVSTAAVPRPAPRPMRSTLGHGRWAALGLPAPRHWRTALHAAWPLLGER
jgi:dTDP-4-dehydrorhamnose reductase